MTPLDRYIEEHTSPAPEPLDALWRDVQVTRLYPRMSTDRVQGRLLAMLAAMQRPRRILEVGAFSGYSALCLAEGLAPDGMLHTIEVDDEAEPHIRRWLARSPLGERITLHIGDAIDIIPSLDERWDMVYLDGNKRQYCQYLDLVLRRLAPGGVILADNTLWSGKVADAAAHDPQTLAMRRFNDRVSADPTLQAVILAGTRDGLTLIRRSM